MPTKETTGIRDLVCGRRIKKFTLTISSMMAVAILRINVNPLSAGAIEDVHEMAEQAPRGRQEEKGGVEYRGNGDGKKKRIGWVGEGDQAGRGERRRGQKGVKGKSGSMRSFKY